VIRERSKHTQTVSPSSHFDRTSISMVIEGPKKHRHVKQCVESSPRKIIKNEQVLLNMSLHGCSGEKYLFGLLKPTFLQEVKQSSLSYDEVMMKSLFIELCSMHCKS